MLDIIDIAYTRAVLAALRRHGRRQAATFERWIDLLRMVGLFSLPSSLARLKVMSVLLMLHDPATRVAEANTQFPDLRSGKATC